MDKEWEDKLNERMRKKAHNAMMACDLQEPNELFLAEMKIVGTLYTKFTAVDRLKTIAKIVETILASENSSDFNVNAYATKIKETDDKTIYTFNDKSKLEI